MENQKFFESKSTGSVVELVELHKDCVHNSEVGASLSEIHSSGLELYECPNTNESTPCNIAKLFKDENSSISRAALSQNAE